MDKSTHDELVAILKANHLFADLDDIAIAELASKIWLETVPAGSKLVREGDPADSLYMVIQGGINVQKANGQFLSYLGTGGFFGEMGLYSTGLQRTADCVSAVDTTVAIIQKKILMDFCDANPSAGLRIYRAIATTLVERLQATSADLATLMGSQVKKQDDVAAMVERARKKKKKEK